MSKGRPVIQMKSMTISAKTVEAAIEKGLQELGITREDAEIEVIQQPSSGLFGLIHKKEAVVEIKEKESAVADDFKNLMKEMNGEREEKSESEEENPIVEETAEPADAVENRSEKKAKEELPFSAKEQEQVAEEAKAFLETIFKSMNLSVQMEKMMNEERILFNLRGDDLGILIGKRGQTLDALQYLTNLASGKDFRRHYFVLLDVENYRERRKHTLETLAHRLADKALRTGERVKLEPMSAGERRIIHLALQKRTDIITDSEGEEPYRFVVIQKK